MEEGRSMGAVHDEEGEVYVGGGEVHVGGGRGSCWRRGGLRLMGRGSC